MCNNDQRIATGSKSGPQNVCFHDSINDGPIKLAFFRMMQEGLKAHSVPDKSSMQDDTINNSNGETILHCTKGQRLALCTYNSSLKLMIGTLGNFSWWQLSLPDKV